MSKYKRILANILFLTGSCLLLYFLLNAPPETTRPLPRDQDHERFMTMRKKEAEQACDSCHGPGKKNQLPETHPPKYRCLFCHKRK